MPDTEVVNSKNKAANGTRAKGRTVTGRSEKLAQEGLCGDCDRLAVGKRVGSGVREVAHDLKGVCGAGRLLHRRERMGYDGVRRLRLDKKPRRSVLRDQKVHFCLRLVPDVVERIVAEAEVVPHVNGLEQMARDKVLEAGAFVCDFAPVPLIPLRRLANRILDVLEPRADGKALVEVFKRGYPCLYRLFRDADFAGEGCRHDLVPGTCKEKLRQDSDSCDVGDLRKIAQVFPEELFAPEFAPAMGEPDISPDKRLRESTMRPERIPVVGQDRARRMDFGCLEFRADKFRDAKRVHVVEEVSSHKAVAAALVDVEPRAAGDDEAHAVFVEIKEPLEKRLPSDELVYLVKRDDGLLFGGDSKPNGIGEPGGIAGDEAARGKVVPREIAICERLGESRLSALARAGKERHLPVVAQMLFKHRFVDSLSLECVFHGSKYIKSDFRRHYQTDRLVRMVNTKLTDGSEWHNFLKHGRGLRPLSFAASGTRAKGNESIKVL